MKKIEDYQMECINGGSNAAEEHNRCLLLGFGFMIVGLVGMVIPAAYPAYAIAAGISGVSSVVGFYASVLSC